MRKKLFSGKDREATQFHLVSCQSSAMRLQLLRFFLNSETTMSIFPNFRAIP